MREVVVPEENRPSEGSMWCTQCRGHLVSSGQEPHRFVCEECGQNFLAILQLVPVEPARRPLLTEGDESAG